MAWYTIKINQLIIYYRLQEPGETITANVADMTFEVWVLPLKKKKSFIGLGN